MTATAGEGGIPGRGDLDVAIVGGGPVGLVAGLLAHEAGLRFAVLERDPEPRRHSRAIGIHPPALRLLDRLGVAGSLVDAGTRIHGGHALSGPGVILGGLDFRRHLPPPWSFVLALPQWRTEEILEARLREVAPGAVRRGVEVLGCDDDGRDGATLRGREDGPGPGGEVAAHTVREDRPGAGSEAHLAARWVLACDGRGSRLRAGAGIDWRGGPYPHRYVMGDFPTAGGAHPDLRGCVPPGTDAALYLHRDGLVESFPLEPGIRRWVVQVGPEGGGVGPPTGTLVAAVLERCGVRLDPEACLMVSSFEAERYRAGRFWKGPVILLGDAAHVVSPIGGQGMNLGWLDAADAVAALAEVRAGRASPGEAATRLEARMGRRFRIVANRAEWNMRLGHRTPLPHLRNLAIRLLLASPARRILARRFTMAGV